MGFFSTRERSELGRSVEIGVERKGRESVRHDFAPRQRSRDDDVAGYLGSLMQRAAQTVVQETDNLIAELQRRREELLNESARVQREINEYAKLSQSAMQSTKIIAQRLLSLKKVPDASVTSELHVKDISNEEHPESGTEPSAQHRDRASRDQS
jgi:hypothetical protein